MSILLGEQDNEQQGGTDNRAGKEAAEATILDSFGTGDTSGDQYDGNGELQDEYQCDVHNWVDTWSRGDNWVDEDRIWVVSVDGFFRRKRKAGYGVMIRDLYGVPIVASASAYRKHVSWLYHALQGIDRGLELAIKYGLNNVFLFYTLPPAIDSLIQNIRSSGGDSFPCYCDRIVCHNCLAVTNTCKGDQDEFRRVYPLIQEIVQKCCMFDYSSNDYMYVDPPPALYCTNTKRRYNVPADYLAKLQVNTKEMEPDEFPEEMKDILYEDAFTCEMMCECPASQRWSIPESRITRYYKEF